MASGDGNENSDDLTKTVRQAIPLHCLYRGLSPAVDSNDALPEMTTINQGYTYIGTKDGKQQPDSTKLYQSLFPNEPVSNSCESPSLNRS